MTCLLKRKARTLGSSPWSAGIPDLAVQDLVRLREGVESDSRATGGAAADRQGVAAESLSILESDVRHVENVEAATANNRLNFRIDEFTNHLIAPKSLFASVNNTGSKRTSASLLVYMREDGFFICERNHVVASQRGFRRNGLQRDRFVCARKAAPRTINPGNNVRQKAKLHREILDTSPGMMMAMLRYKAARAGGRCDVICRAAAAAQGSRRAPGVVRASKAILE
jgi:hypothetical protein